MSMTIDPLAADITVGAIVQHGFMALMGAIAHAINAHRNGTSKGPMDFALLTIMSSFSGVVFALLAIVVFNNNEYLTMAAAGAGGFLGVEGLTVLAAKIRDALSNIIK